MRGGFGIFNGRLPNKNMEHNDLNIYEVVRYFVEKSGMLFFYTLDDVRHAYNRIKTDLNCEKKYYGVYDKEENEKIELYYSFFIRKFNEYIENNKDLFDIIMGIDDRIRFCGSNSSFELYIKNMNKQLKEANSSYMFFQRRYNIKRSKKKLESIIERIREYRFSYNLDLEGSKIDEVLNFLGLTSLASEKEIVDAYSKMFEIEYKKIIDDDTIDNLSIKKKSDQIEYVRSVIACAYDLDSELEEKTIYEMYTKTLNEEPEYYNAFRYFNLTPNCTKEEMIDAIEEKIYNITSSDLISTSYMTGGSLVNGGFVGKVKNDYEDLRVAEHYKGILYSYFGIKEEIIESEDIKNTPITVTVRRKNTGSAPSYEELFNNLSYNEARKLYYSLMNKMLNSKNSESDILKLKKYWDSIKGNFEEEDTITRRPRK